MAKVVFTAGRVSGFKCQADKQQAFMWDLTAPGLGLRVTPNGKPSYIFQGLYQGKYVRVTIGSPAAWSIADAQTKARELQRLIDEGKDPRDLKRETIAATEAKRLQEQEQVKADKLAAVTVGYAWADYVKDRTPHWGELHLADHKRLTRAGGEQKDHGTKGRGMTNAGPLYLFMALPLSELTQERIDSWAATEAKTRPTAARLALRLLRAFMNWCADDATYAACVSSKNPAKSRRAREALGKAGAKTDALLREQLPAWFDAVRGIPNAAMSVYLQTLLLTGARPGEVLALRWGDLNTKWRGLTIRDKVEGERVIPLTPYVHHLLASLPRRGPHIFAARTGDGTMMKPNKAHAAACQIAALEGLTLHGLRRSFKSLTEWLEVPSGVVAQIMGHKPSATAEKHYTVRPLDLLRVHHERIEAWILEQGGVRFDAKVKPGKLRVVAA